MTPEEEEEERNAARPKRLRWFSAEEAGSAIFSGDAELVALYIRQTLRPGQSVDYNFLTALADALDPEIKTETKFVFKRSKAGRPAADKRFWEHHFGERREIVAEVASEERRLLGKNKARTVTRARAVEIVAKRRNVTPRTVWSELSAAGVPRKKRGPKPTITEV